MQWAGPLEACLTLLAKPFSMGFVVEASPLSSIRVHCPWSPDVAPLPHSLSLYWACLGGLSEYDQQHYKPP